MTFFKGNAHYYELIKDEIPTDSRYGKQIIDFINSLQSPKILELGGGNGRFVKFLKNHSRYCIVDLSDHALAAFPQDQKIGIEFKKEDLNGVLSFEENSFDVVFSTWTLEHMLDPRTFLAEQARISSKFIILLAPNLEIPWSIHNSIRHRSIFYKASVQIKRIINAVSILFGREAFLTEKNNISDELSIYEKEDDDLRYYVGATEVIRFMSRLNCRLIASDNTIVGAGLKNKLKRAYRFLSRMKYAGAPILFIFEKHA